MCFLSPALLAEVKESSVFLVMETLMVFLGLKSADEVFFAADEARL